jgi:hypothetical protein
MPTQTLGSLKVVVNNQDLGTVKVRQSNQVDAKVQSISYGQPLEIRKAIDLDLAGAETGEAVIYNAASGTFEIGPAIADANTITNISGGTF